MGNMGTSGSNAGRSAIAIRDETLARLHWWASKEYKVSVKEVRGIPYNTVVSRLLDVVGAPPGKEVPKMKLGRPPGVVGKAREPKPEGPVVHMEP